MFDLTFLNSTFLIGLLGALLPLLIHLLNRRRIKIIPFSTLKYLTPLQKKQMRRMRIREILLLLVRMAIVAFLALAMARPALKGSFGGDVGAHSATSIVIVVDDSFSLGYEANDGTLFNRTRQRALALIDFLKESDDANVIFTSRPDAPVFDQPTHNFSLIRELINSHGVSMAKGQLLSSVILADTLLDTSNNLNKEIYLITDLQAAAWDTAEIVWPSFKDKNRLFIIDVGEKNPQNIYIDHVDYANQLLFADRPIRFTAGVFNGSQHEVDNQLLELYVNGLKKSQVGISGAPGGYTSGQMSMTFEEAKPYAGYVEMPDDALIADNRRYFALDIRGEVQALIVADDIADEAPNSFFLQSVLNPLGKGETRIIPTVKKTTDMGAVQLSAYQVVILSNVKELSAGQTAMLERFVTDGGGLMIVLGDQSDVRYYNETLLPTFLPAKIKSLRGGEEGAFFSWGKIDFQHYIFQAFKDSDNPFQSLQFNRTFEILPEKGVAIPVAYNNQMPALLTREMGRGFVAVLPTSLDNKWNSLPIRAGFVPLMHRAIQFLGLGGGAAQTLTVGSPATREVANIPLGAETACVKPSGDVVKVSPELKSNQSVLRFTETDEIGIYAWRVGSETVGQFAVNVDVSEANLTRSNPADLMTRFPDQNVVFVSGNDSLKDKVLQIRFGRELWKPFLWVVFLLLLVELGLAWSLGREKKLEPVVGI